jgi:hypothetical protein
MGDYLCLFFNVFLSLSGSLNLLTICALLSFPPCVSGLCLSISLHLFHVHLSVCVWGVSVSLELSPIGCQWGVGEAWSGNRLGFPGLRGPSSPKTGSGIQKDQTSSW